MDYSEFFKQATGWPEAQGWQKDLVGSSPESRLIRIPTGFGKTLGVMLAWLWHRHQTSNESWPLRLVWCLPMRVLVEQTLSEAQAVLSRLGILWDGETSHTGKVGVHALMGGVDSGDWHLYPENAAVLIGTQDMLLSRALNRGYGAARGRWPMEFGLLNHDCLWVMDEVQLMDVGLATSGQMQSFRVEDQQAGKSIRPCFTWWMSATLQRAWLDKSPETVALATSLPQTEIAAAARVGHLWTDVHKPVRLALAENYKAIAELVAHEHLRERGAQGLTLLVLNRVDDALAVYDLLEKNKALHGTDIRLVHSRFRPHERASWREDFLNRDACAAGTDRVIVATQVVEAGVDISAAILITALAPWPGLVQRFGRCARWGGKAEVIVVDQSPKDDKAAAPYSKAELDAAREALRNLDDVSPLRLEAFEESHPDLLPALYPYDPKSLLLRHEVDELFDTTPDLSGADVDISKFIRSGDERDLQVFWVQIELTEKYPDKLLRPSREALCNVPFLKAREWLCGKESASIKAPRLKKTMRAWVWDWLGGNWRQAERRDMYPGQTILVAADCGGYEEKTGWAPDSRKPVESLKSPEIPPDERADSSEDDETLSVHAWQTIALHGATVGRLAADIANNVLTGKSRLLDLAGRWHDAGKVHDAFQNSIRSEARPSRRDLAKAPDEAWVKGRKLYTMSDRTQRAGFRHELASTLALFAVLQRHTPKHAALLGPWQSFFETAGIAAQSFQDPVTPPNLLEQEIIDLSADDFDLLAYLVCSHHGKVRVAWHASPSDQEAADDLLRIRGVRNGELLPTVLLATADGSYIELPASAMNLAASSVGLNPSTGRGWTERVLNLLKQYGPFSLAWMEALLRAADQRASRLPINDPLLEGKGAAI